MMKMMKMWSNNPTDKPNQYLVVYTLCDPTSTDYYEVFDNRQDAQKRYEKLINLNETHSASVCIPLVSTDYNHFSISDAILHR